MKRREFGEPIPMRLIEEDRLAALLELEHRIHCGGRVPFEYFWDMMVESGCDQHVSHREFVEVVENMTFGKLAEMDLELYEEYKAPPKKEEGNPCLYE